MEQTLFKDLDLSNEIIMAIEDLKFEYATEIQSKAIPVMKTGKDLMGLSQTGSGKTLAFAIPIIESIKDSKKIESLVLCPTRELALQIEEVFFKLTKYRQDLKILSVYGGSSIENQMRALRKGVNVVIGTPGRIMDLIRRKSLHLEALKIAVLDEADEMLNMGFKEDVEEIFKYTPDYKQVVLFSATMPKEIINISKNIQNDPEIIRINKKELTVKSIDQYYLNIKGSEKKQALLNLIYKHQPNSALIFANTKRMVDELQEYLYEKDLKVNKLHGDMSQAERTKVLNSFKENKINILIASDVAARGIDVNDIEIVFNYDLPQTHEYYVHRIGRTGRAGKTGIAYTFINGKRQLNELIEIAKSTNSNIKEGKLPKKLELIENLSVKFVDKVESKLKDGAYESYNYISQTLLNKGHKPEHIINVLSSMLINLDINEIKNESIDKKVKKVNLSGKTATLIIFLGKKDKVAANHIVCAIVEEVGIESKQIGKIKIESKYSLVDVPVEYSKDVIKALSKIKIRNQKVRIEEKRK
jgi:ATP-dependent RNA helicase DeaD